MSKRVVVSSVLVGALVFAVAGVWLSSVDSRAEQKRRVAEKVRIAQDYVDELNAKVFEVPDGDRAIVLYREAGSLLPRQPWQWWEIDGNDWPGKPGMPSWDQMVGYLQINAESLALVHEASAKAVLGNEIGLALVDAMNLDSTAMEGMGHMRDLLRFVATDLHRATELKDSQRAIDDALSLLALGRHAMSGKSLLWVITGTSIDSTATNGILRFLEDHPDVLDRDQLDRLSRTLAIDDSQANLEAALEHERIESLYASVHIDSMKKLDKNGFWPRLDKITEATRAYMAFDPWDERAWAWSLDRRQRNLGPDDDGSRVKMLFRSFHLFRDARSHAVNNASRHDAARIAIALIRYHRQHGSYPQTLDELVPAYLDAIPLDPMDGQPLRYRLVDGSPLLYSLGPDGDDDDGRGWSLDPKIWPHLFPDEDPIDGDWVLWPVLDELVDSR